MPPRMLPLFARRRRLSVASIAVLVAVAVFGLAGCRETQPAVKPQPEPTRSAPSTQVTPPSAIPTAPSTEPTSPSPTAGKPIEARIYLTRGEKIGVAGRELPAGTKAVASATMKLLLQAPSATDRRYGLGTVIPNGTQLLGLSIRNGVGTVDLSKGFESGGGSLSMQMRVAQVVCTLTQFPSISRVAFRIEGRAVESIGGEGVLVSPPVKPSDFENVLPAILVEGPTPGQTIPSPFRLFGTANVFEAQFNMRLVQGGKILAESQLMATSGTGTRGTFSKRITFAGGHAGQATLEVYDISEKDGSRIDLVSIPVRLR